MEHGDIDNQPAQRLVFVWEGLLAHLDLQDLKRHNRLIKRHRYDRALEYWAEDLTMTRLLRDILYRRHLMVDVLTITGIDGFGHALERRLDREGYPYGRVIISSTAAYARELAYAPEVHTVFHGDQNSPFLFGSRGRAISSPLDVVL